MSGVNFFCFCFKDFCFKGDEIKQYPVPKLDDDKILDTNGAGDAFVGGFFAQYLKGESIEKCIDCGIWISQIVIQRSGCTFPDKAEYC